jgi:transposase
METTTEHYRLLLGLNDRWDVNEVNLFIESKKVEIHLGHVGAGGVCPVCNTDCPLADHAPDRQWRHLDTMQFETVIFARVPRTRCNECGVKTTQVPWAEKHSRFTLMFEAMAIPVLQACASVKSASELLNIDWDSAHSIMKRAVDRGVKLRDIEEVENIGVDEKSFRKRQSYVSVMVDIDKSRVIEVTEGRDRKAADKLWGVIPLKNRGNIKAVAMDMSATYMASANANAPDADIVHDKFHISKNLNEAVNDVRKQEHRKLQKEDSASPLTGSRQMWLYNPENLPEDLWMAFTPLKDSQLKTARAWAIKEQLRWFWEYKYRKNAEKFFDGWYNWATHSRLAPIIKVAKSLKNHIDNILTYFRHRITNATSEGTNSKIQSIKSSARGFRVFENYRTRILFHCGKLDMIPGEISH